MSTATELLENAEMMAEVEELKAAIGPDATVGEGIPKDISDPTRLLRVYVAATGEPRDVPSWTLDGKNSILRRRDAAKKPVFVTKRPANAAWKLGSHVCPLNPNHPDRQKLYEIGIVQTCDAEHLGSAYSVRIHMQHRHKQENAMWQEHVQQEREDEYRENQRLLARAAAKAIGDDEAPRRQSRGA